MSRIKGKKRFPHSEETKRKIGDANRRPIYFNCDYCKKEATTKLSAFKRKKRHFCSMNCYSLFRKEKMPFYEHSAYRGVRRPGETKQVYHRNYCKNNPANISHLKARGYARKQSARGFHALKEWEEMKRKHDFKCVSCGQRKPLTKDHVIPLSESGSDFIENIQPLCRNCNSKKWKFLAWENPELLESK